MAIASRDIVCKMLLCTNASNPVFYIDFWLTHKTRCSLQKPPYYPSIRVVSSPDPCHLKERVWQTKPKLSVLANQTAQSYWLCYNHMIILHLCYAHQKMHFSRCFPFGGLQPRPRYSPPGHCLQILKVSAFGVASSPGSLQAACREPGNEATFWGSTVQLL